MCCGAAPVAEPFSSLVSEATVPCPPGPADQEKFIANRVRRIPREWINEKKGTPKPGDPVFLSATARFGEMRGRLPAPFRAGVSQVRLRHRCR